MILQGDADGLLAPLSRHGLFEIADSGHRFDIYASLPLTDGSALPCRTIAHGSGPFNVAVAVPLGCVSGRTSSIVGCSQSGSLEASLDEWFVGTAVRAYQAAPYSYAQVASETYGIGLSKLRGRMPNIEEPAIYIPKSE